MGAALPRHRPEFAARLGRGDPVFCVPRRGPPDHLHHKRDRSFELEAQASCQGQGTLPKRRGRHQAALFDLESVGKRVEDATMWVDHGEGAIAVIFGERFIRDMAA